MGKKAQKRRKRIIPMMVIPKPEEGTRAVIVVKGDGSQGSLAFRSTVGPPITLVCGKCRTALVERMTVDQIQSMVIRCNRCGAYNESLA